MGRPDSANVRIRGVGSLYLSGTDDNSVVVNVDGVPTSVSNVGLGTLDAEQIEVLKGPRAPSLAAAALLAPSMCAPHRRCSTTSADTCGENWATIIIIWPKAC